MTVALAPVRRWVRQRRNATRDTGSMLGNVYFVLLFAVTVTGLFWPTVKAVFWPEAATGSALTAVGVPLVCAGAVLIGLRRLGPLGVSRPAASWLLTAPVSRRALLAPSAGSAAAAGAGLGALTAFATISQVAARPMPVFDALTAVLAGAFGGVAVVLAAVVAQRSDRTARWTDRAALIAVVLGAAALLAERLDAAAVLAGRLGFAAPLAGPAAESRLSAAAAAPVVIDLRYPAAVGALVVTALAVLVFARLERTPAHRILAASQAAGTVFDAAYVGQPSFVTDLLERRFWAGRRWRSARLSARLPLLVAQDLRVLARRRRRLLRVGATAVLPAVLAPGSDWVLAAAILLGAMAAAGSVTASIRTDAADPALLRLLALSGRTALWYRLWLPSLLAALWCAAALLLATVLGALPGGPWWALGLVLGPAVAAGAARRARQGIVQHGLLPLDTPLGGVETGPVLAAVAGYDLLVALSLPALVMLGQAAPLTGQDVALQAVWSGLGVLAYARYSTTEDARL